MIANLKITRSSISSFVVLLFIISATHTTIALSQGRSTSLIINHTCTDLDQIPTEWIITAKDSFKMYYGHTSHGSQLLVGMERIESLRGGVYNVAYSNYTNILPNEQDAFCILDLSNTPENWYLLCSRYLNQNPSINLAMFSWCSQGGYPDWQSYLSRYLSEIQDLEKAYPIVKFIYMTNNAQSNGEIGYYRYQFNQAIRQFCTANNKILFDFADLDSWYNGNQNTYEYNGITIPLEHPQYNANEGDADYACHTNYESCENKGKAVWWMLANLAGWNDTTPVELISLEAYVKGKAVQLSWVTASQTNNFGFDVERSLDKTNFSTVGFVMGHGSLSIPKCYQFLDEKLEEGNCYYYRLKQIDIDGRFTYSHIITVEVGTPKEFELIQNYPNPFNPETTISYTLVKDGYVSLRIVDILGREVRNLVNDYKNAGQYTIKWDGKDNFGNGVSTGLYICRMKGVNFNEMRKIMLAK